MKPYANFVEFEVSQLFTDKVKINGREIWFDPTFRPHEHIQKWGIVTQIPQRLSQMPIPTQITDGCPEYYEKVTRRYKYLSDIEPEVKVGDKIWFHHNTIDIPHLKNLLREEGEGEAKRYYFKVRYDQIICSVREISKEEVDEELWDKENPDTKYNVIIPIGGWTLVQPDWESFDDILVPTYSDILDGTGKPTLRPKSEWIQKKSVPGYRHLTGFMIHIGTPLQGDTCEMEPGDKVWYRNNGDWLLDIEGDQFFAIRMHHLLGHWGKRYEQK